MKRVIYLLICLAYVRVAQLDRATGYGPVGRGFESCHAHLKTILRGCLFLVMRLAAHVSNG